MNVLLLDAYHLGDPLFAGALARALAPEARPPVVLVHGGGDAAERLLEAQGRFPERRDGRIVPSSAEEAALVESAVRGVNRKLVAVLTDAVVHAVGLQGADRGLLRAAPEGGGVAAGDVAWLRALTERGVVPVVSALVRAAGAPESAPAREVSAAQTAEALAAALDAAGGGAATVVAFTRANRPGVATADGDGVRAEMPCDELPADAVEDAAAVCALARSGRAVLLTSVAGLTGPGAPRGTRLAP